MRLASILLAFVLVTGLAGCDGAKAHTVDYYKTHEAERLAKLKECRADPGELRETPNCVNAETAAEKLLLDSKNSGIPRLRAW